MVDRSNNTWLVLFRQDEVYYCVIVPLWLTPLLQEVLLYSPKTYYQHSVMSQYVFFELRPRKLTVISHDVCNTGFRGWHQTKPPSTCGLQGVYRVCGTTSRVSFPRLGPLCHILASLAHSLRWLIVVWKCPPSWSTSPGNSYSRGASMDVYTLFT